jgi:hypothetical protein
MNDLPIDELYQILPSVGLVGAVSETTTLALPLPPPEEPPVAFQTVPVYVQDLVSAVNICPTVGASGKSNTGIIIYLIIAVFVLEFSNSYVALSSVGSTSRN